MPVQLKNISLKNFKSVSVGTFPLDSLHLQQLKGALCLKHNAVIEALSLCKRLMTGQALGTKAIHLIRPEATQLECTLRFSINDSEISYGFSLCCHGQQPLVHSEHITVVINTLEMQRTITCTSNTHTRPMPQTKQGLGAQSALFYPEIITALPRLVETIEKHCRP